MHGKTSVAEMDVPLGILMGSVGFGVAADCFVEKVSKFFSCSSFFFFFPPFLCVTGGRWLAQMASVSLSSRLTVVPTEGLLGPAVE